MPGEKRRNSKAGGRSGAVAALGVAGALSLSGACSASASTSPTGNMRNAQVPLGEEEVSDVSLSTFYVFDKENAQRSGVQLAAGRGCGGGRGCAARGCGHGCGGGGCGGCGGWRGCGGCGGCGCCFWVGPVRIC
jgi:hypothetical protein